MGLDNNPLWAEDCRKAYLECALWADWPEENSPRTIYDSTRATWEQAGRDVAQFARVAKKAYGLDVTKYPAEMVGHDLWLTRNHHGAGFWDTVNRRPWQEKTGEKLTKLAHAMGERHPYHVAGRFWAIE